MGWIIKPPSGLPALYAPLGSPAKSAERVDARRALMLALLSLPAQGAARYQVCDFTCAEPANASWLACRAEKCTPRLPEDLCSDGSEPTLTPEPGAKEGEGRAVAGPAECTEAGAPALGSFAERCELCLSLAQSAINLARRPRLR